ncbi:MAG: hypothetical protein PHX09_02635 [Clostridia bacterium]|nr:hypothetical protein [Clostridia bacterium]MDD4686271.1 hypothetical protein [Clostridia bacterium]
MGKKRKFITSIIALTLVLAVMTVGVMAATSLTVNFSNSVTYTASAHVKATISATQTAGANTSFQGGTGANPTPISLIGSEDETAQLIEMGDVILSATDTSVGTIIYSYTVTVLNEATLDDEFKYLTVTFISPATKTYAAGSYGIEVAYSGTVASPSATKTLSPSETLTMTVTFTGDVSVSHSEDFSGSISLESVKVAP